METNKSNIPNPIIVIDKDTILNMEIPALINALHIAYGDGCDTIELRLNQNLISMIPFNSNDR